MGLTTRNLQSQLVTNNLPHYFVVKRGPNWQRHCGTMRDVESMLSIYPDATVTQVFPPNPTVVAVPHITVTDQEWPMHQILPESPFHPLHLYHSK